LFTYLIFAHVIPKADPNGNYQRRLDEYYEKKGITPPRLPPSSLHKGAVKPHSGAHEPAHH